MLFFQIPTSGDRNFGYIIGDPGAKLAALIDPSPDPRPCENKILELGLTVKYLINTHGHFDHSAGNDYCKEKFDVPLVAHPLNTSADMACEDGEILKLGTVSLTFIHTPGHTADSMCVLAGDDLVTGDTLFVGKVGGTATREEAGTEFDSLIKLMSMNRQIRVWPGHNYGVKPASTIGKEIETNPFCQRLDDFEKFYWLKENWAQYKKDHGIP